MPRPRRLNLIGIPQHITQRGNNRQVCFFDDHDRFTYLELLRRAAQRRSCDIHAYVLMTNHVHILMTPSVADGASRLMQDVGREYVRYINGLYRRSGTLWEGRFKSSLVDSADYCLICHLYIELNPVRAAMVQSPADYRWSSHHFNALGREDDLITPHEEWMALGRDKQSRCTAYRTLFDQTLGDERIEQIRYSNRKGLPLGRKSFRAQIETQLQIKLGTGKVGRPPKSE
ncbi:MAG: transposase [Xanthomonadales bacterium]|nr:transposase [Gammaproteobacteria bacterium]NND56562.1 transposase [Xanthomonadales bacterium]RZW25444.1 MAG: transposase [Desulfobulbaceae bacterium]MBT8052328.1 transposase [Gammaproteobacteria bacterium]NNK52539.1 transposase [Xanthomonadales bacterium]